MGNQVSDKQWQKLKQIFSEALKLEGSEQNAYIENMCGDDQQLLEEAKSLIRAYNSPGPLDRSLNEVKVSALTDYQSEEKRGKKAGSYKIVGELGHGGMGSVYLAERADGQFDQRVALKLLRTGFTTENQTRRFLAERQILASLNHKNIARLLDGGVTDDGQPFYVMEYIDGQPIDRYCDEKKLTISRRLELFLEVCKAIQYAHQKLIVHRDLKPSNILVEDDGSVKLLDFGIAKALNSDELMTGRMPLTKTGLLPLTPAYASPEQVRGENIATASDIYQLGVVLYELLTGSRPYEVTGRSPSEVEQIICRQQPTRPSTAITKLPSVAEEEETTPVQISSARQTQPEQLQKQLRGDLDTIVLKALRKEPERRYESAEKLASDIHNYLSGKPVSAHPDSLMYRGKKFITRHKAGVLSGAAIVLLLVGYAVTITWHSQQTQTALELAEQEAVKAAQVTDFLMDMFEASDPNQFPGTTVTAGDLLERGVQQAEQLENQPEIQAQMMDLTGRIYMNLGQYDLAGSLLERGLELRQEIFEPNHAGISESLHNLGVLKWNRGRYETAEEYLRESLQMKRQIYHTDNESIATTMSALAIVLKELRNFDQAEPLYREALAINLDLFGEVHEDVAYSLNNLGNFLESTGEFQKAEEHYLKSLNIYRELYGNDHPQVAGRLNNLGGLQINKGDLREAMKFHEEALKIRQSVFDEMHPDIAESYYNLGIVHMDLEHYEQAEQHLQKALTIRQTVLDSLHPNTSQTLNVLGILNQRTDNFEAATEYFTKALEIQKSQLGEKHSEVGIQLNNIGLLLVRQERFSEAMETLERAREIMNHNFEYDHPLQTYPFLGMANVYMRTGRPVQAEPLIREALSIQQASADPGNWLIGHIMALLGSCLADQEQFEEAENYLLGGYEILEKQFGVEHARTQTAIGYLVGLYENLPHDEKAAAYRELLSDNDSQ
jgi:eukaryotic-like serine/threonine-protein kinase